MDSLNRPIDVVNSHWSEEFILTIVKDLFVLNRQSYNYRYLTNTDIERPDDLREMADEVICKYIVDDTKPLDVYQMLKSCRCLRYNCDGLPDVELNKSYCILSVIIDRLKSHIINHLPEYKAAEWR